MACPHTAARLRVRAMGGIIQKAAAVAGFFIALSGMAPMPLAADATTPASCTKEEFESVVEDAAAKLRDLNNENRPAFQEKLRELKDKRKWTHDEFIEKAKPFVRDD